MASAMPDLWLPSQPRGITALWLVPNYTAWWQRHICVNNLPKVITRQYPGAYSNLRPWVTSGLQVWHVTVRLPSHAVCSVEELIISIPLFDFLGWSYYMDQRCRLHRSPCIIEKSLAPPFWSDLPKFGTLIGNDNAEKRWRRNFNITPLANFLAIFPKICITGIG